MANKKINQLVAKTTIQSTDLFPIGDATTGTLFKKTIADLQAAIGGAVISVNGLVGTVVLDTDDILEPASPTNKYFTEARARAAISLTTTGSSGASTYSSSTGVLNVPTYTLAGLGGITASFLSGGTGISYNSTTGVISYSGTVYTDSSVRGLFSAGTGISYNSSTGVITNSAVYSDSSIRALFSGTSPITYNSTTGAIGISTGNLTEATSSVLTITGGTGALISSASIEVKQASGSQSGFLSSTDWTTFNSKQSAISGGTSGYGTFWTGSSTLGADSAFFWDNTNKRLGIGTVTPDSYLQVYYNTSSSSYTDIAHVGSGAGKSLFLGVSGYGFSLNDSASGAGWGIKTDWDSGYMGFHYGASEKVRINSSGNVGIGITSPTQKLDVNGAIKTLGNYFAVNNTPFTTNGTITYHDTVGLTLRGATGYVYDFAIYNTSATALLVNPTGTSNMAFLNGKLSVGTTGNIFGSTFQVNQNNAGNVIAHFYDSTGDAGYYFSNYSNLIVFEGRNSAGTGYKGFSSLPYGGNFLIGTLTDNGEKLYVSGSIRATGTITANSDINLKKNLLKIENALEKVEQINGYTYEFKADDSKRHAGVIAQEIQEILPEIVNKGNDGILGVEYGNISALLIEAIKEQQKKINELEVKLIALGQ